MKTHSGQEGSSRSRFGIFRGSTRPLSCWSAAREKSRDRLSSLLEVSESRLSGMKICPISSCGFPPATPSRPSCTKRSRSSLPFSPEIKSGKKDARREFFSFSHFYLFPGRPRRFSLAGPDPAIRLPEPGFWYCRRAPSQIRTDQSGNSPFQVILHSVPGESLGPLQGPGSRQTKPLFRITRQRVCPAIGDPLQRKHSLSPCRTGGRRGLIPLVESPPLSEHGCTGLW